MKDALITVIIPVYSNENSIEKAIESIINQSIGINNIEILIINDGIIDNSFELLSKYGNSCKNIKLYSQDKVGYGISINRGLDLATGEYIVVLDPSDFIAPTMFGDLYNVACEYNHEVSVIRSSAIYDVNKDNDCVIKKQVSTVGQCISYKIEYTLNIETSPYLLNEHVFIGCAMYKRSFLKKNNIRFQETKGSSFKDLAFYIEVLFCAKIIAYTNIPYYYKVNKKMNMDEGFLFFEVAKHLVDTLKEHSRSEFKLWYSNIMVLIYTNCMREYDLNISSQRLEEFLTGIKQMLEEFKANNKDIHNEGVFNKFRYVNDQKYNDVQLLMNKGSKYLDNKIQSQHPNKFRKFIRIILKILMEPIMVVVVLVLLPIYILQELITLRMEKK